MKKRLYLIIILLTVSVFAANTAYGQHRSRHKHTHETVSSCPLIDSIIDFSKTKLGCAYRSGGTGPNAFDCSGFVYYVFGHFNITLGRSSRDQILMGQKVDRKDIRPGDLVFWYRGKGYVGHAGLVVEVDSNHNFKFIHAATHGKGVRYDYSTSNWYTSTYAGARRIIDCDGNGQAYLVKADGRSSTEIDIQTKPEPKDTVSPIASSINETTKQEVKTEIQQKITYHKVKKGETLSTIARKYHVSVSQLKQWNHLRSDMIREDAKLKIVKNVTVPVTKTVVATPATDPAPAAPVTQTEEKKESETPTVEKTEPAKPAAPQPKIIYHKIKQGETLSSIARKYHVTVNQLKQWNHLKSDMIREDAKLKIIK